MELEAVSSIVCSFVRENFGVFGLDLLLHMLVYPGGSFFSRFDQRAWPIDRAYIINCSQRSCTGRGTCIDQAVKDGAV